MPYLDPTIDAHILCNGQPWEVGAELCPSLVPTIDAHILCNGQLCAAGAEICPLMVISAEVPISWTTLSDSESRLSRFIRAITSFRCNCSWRSNRLQFSLWEKKNRGDAGWLRMISWRCRQSIWSIQKCLTMWKHTSNIPFSLFSYYQ